jgi:hypothetical protein
MILWSTDGRGDIVADAHCGSDAPHTPCARGSASPELGKIDGLEKTVWTGDRGLHSFFVKNRCGPQTDKINNTPTLVVNGG